MMVSVVMHCHAAEPQTTVAQSRDVYPVRSGPSALSLNGSWHFRYVTGSELGADANFSDTGPAGSKAWPTITVPGHWELQGFAPPKYGKDQLEGTGGTGLYRRNFRVPAAWQGQRVFLHFDGVLYGFDAWVNGTKVGSWASSYNPAAFDITDTVNRKGDNVLAVRVTTRNHGWEFDVNDCWALSGIYRDVTLFAVPPAHFQSCIVQTRVAPDGTATLSVATRLSADASVNGRLLAPDGQAVGPFAFQTDAATDNDTIIRPALASIAGCLLMLSDKPEVYADDRNLVGIRRSSPVLFSVPGQLYDFDAAKTDVLKNLERNGITTRSEKPSIDGDRNGQVCPWWLNEFNLGFGHWNVLHRINWSASAAGPAQVRFRDIGLDGEREYLVFEFWTDRVLGVFKSSFEAPSIGPMGLHSFAIREKTDRPQILSTNRHLSQGAADLEAVAWENNLTLTGRSRVVAGDRYVITLHLPPNYSIDRASFDDEAAEVKCDGAEARVAFLPPATDSVGWKIEFLYQRGE